MLNCHPCSVSVERAYIAWPLLFLSIFIRFIQLSFYSYTLPLTLLLYSSTSTILYFLKLTHFWSFFRLRSKFDWVPTTRWFSKWKEAFLKVSQKNAIGTSLVINTRTNFKLKNKLLSRWKEYGSQLVYCRVGPSLVFHYLRPAKGLCKTTILKHGALGDNHRWSFWRPRVNLCSILLLLWFAVSKA